MNNVFASKTRWTDLIWEVQGGYKEVNKLAGEPAHIKAVRNELQKPNLLMQHKWSLLQDSRSLLSHYTTRTKLSSNVLKAKHLRKWFISIFPPERWNSCHCLSSHAYLKPEACSEMDFWTNILVDHPQLCSQPCMTPDSAHHQILSNVLPHQMFREQILQPEEHYYSRICFVIFLGFAMHIA